MRNGVISINSTVRAAAEHNDSSLCSDGPIGLWTGAPMLRLVDPFVYTSNIVFTIDDLRQRRRRRKSLTLVRLPHGIRLGTSTRKSTQRSSSDFFGLGGHYSHISTYLCICVSVSVLIHCLRLHHTTYIMLYRARIYKSSD